MSSTGYCLQQRWGHLAKNITINECRGSYCAAVVRGKRSDAVGPIIVKVCSRILLKQQTDKYGLTLIIQTHVRVQKKEKCKKEKR